MAQNSYAGIVLAAPSTVPYARYSPHGAHWFFGALLRDILTYTGIPKHRIDGLSAASFSLAPDTAIGVVEHLGMTARFVDHIPLGGASGIAAVRRAARAVQCGDADIVACLAGETNDADAFRRSTASFSRFGQDAVYPYGSGGPNASFALLTDHYMRRYGAAAEDFGRICIAQRQNALSTPHALFRSPLTMEDYLASRMIADPIRLYDCVMPCAGGEGFLVMRAEAAAEFGLPHVYLAAAVERHNAFPEDVVQDRGGWVVDADALFGEAGVDRRDIDFFQSYDDYPVMTMMQIEDLGFCRKGEAPSFVREHDLTVEGDFPLNTSGGQLSTGQAGAAGGFLGIVEAIRQLTGRPLGRVVNNAKVGLVSGFGMMNYDRGLSCGAAILSFERIG